MEAQSIINFWFLELEPEQWFEVDHELDELIKNKFLETFRAASRGELSHWRISSIGRLAEIIVLDQFPRNMFRGQAEAFATDRMSLILAQEMVIQGLDLEIPIEMRAFAYMPFMHSESPIIHVEAMRLFKTKGLEENLKYEIEHKRIIDLFGRYPHRNIALNRVSTQAEIDFMKSHKGF